MYKLMPTVNQVNYTERLLNVEPWLGVDTTSEIVVYMSHQTDFESCSLC